MALEAATPKGPAKIVNADDSLLLSTLDDLASWTTECDSNAFSSSTSVGSPQCASGCIGSGTNGSMEATVDELFATEGTRIFAHDEKQASSDERKSDSTIIGRSDAGTATNTHLSSQTNAECDEGIRKTQCKATKKASKKEGTGTHRSRAQDREFEAWWDATVKSLFSPELLREGILRIVEALSKLIDDKTAAGDTTSAADIEELRRAQAQLDVYREFVHSMTTDAPTNGTNCDQWLVEKFEALTRQLESLGDDSFPNMLESLFARERNAIMEALQSDSLKDLLKGASADEPLQERSSTASPQNHQTEDPANSRENKDQSYSRVKHSPRPRDKYEAGIHQSDPSDVEAQLLVELLPRIISEAFPPSVIQQLEQLGNNNKLEGDKKSSGTRETIIKNGAAGEGQFSDDDDTNEDDDNDSVSGDSDRVLSEEELQSLQAVEHWLGKVLQEQGA